MNLNHLVYFVSVVDNLSFTEASKKLFVSQPTLSHGISALESELGTKLFVRGHHSLAPTPEGKKLYDLAKEIITLTNKIYDEVKPKSDTGINSLRIGFMADLLPMCFPSVVSPFLQENSDIHAHMDQNYVVELHSALENRNLDIIFTRASSIIDIPINDYKTVLIKEDCFCLVVPSNHRLASNDSITDLSVLKDEHFIAMNPEHTSPLVQKITRICNNRGYNPKIEATEHMLDAVLARVASRGGVTITPKSYIYFKKYPDIKKINLSDGPDIMNDIVACYQTTNSNPSLQRFVEYLNTHSFYI